MRVILRFQEIIRIWDGVIPLKRIRTVQSAPFGWEKSKETGFLVYNGSYITIKNFQLTNYDKMVYGNISDHIFLENIITVHGNRNIQIVGERSHDNVILNCVGYNGGLHNFSIDGTESLVQDNLSYCDRNDNSTDYYYSVFGSDHVIRAQLFEASWGVASLWSRFVYSHFFTGSLQRDGSQ